MIIKKNATIHIKARIFYGDYLYGFIISLILSSISVFLFLWTQRTITILSGLRLLNRIMKFNMGNWDIPLAIVVCLGVIITALVFIVFAKIEQS